MGRLSRRAARRRDDRGASLIEFAIVAPILFMLLFGVIDFGVLYSRTIAVRSGVRAATRHAVVARFGNDTSCAVAGLSPENDPLRRTVCSVKREIGLPAEWTRVRLVLLEGDGDGAAAHEHYDDLMVCAMTKVRSVTGFFDQVLNGRAHLARLVMMIEKAPDLDPTISPLVTGGESPLGGQDWSWCDPSRPAP